MTKYIFTTGGVVSGIGKGIVAASIGNLLTRYNYSVSILKCDPYLNIDPGTMNPQQHGEVFVTRDGAETDLDLGHYERFINTPLSKLNSISTGTIYNSILNKERRGEYKGGTVQIFHVVEEIKNRIRLISTQQSPDFLIIEIGGTVGDMESIPFLEAVRQIQSEEDNEDVCCVHLVYIPYLSNVGEHKTKPAQHSVRSLRETGITPDIIITRAETSLEYSILEKVSKYCYTDVSNVIDCPNVSSLYQVPQVLEKNNIIKCLRTKLNFKRSVVDPEWNTLVSSLSKPKLHNVHIAMVGKYSNLKDSYISITEALIHASLPSNVNLSIEYIKPSSLSQYNIKAFDGVVIPGGFGSKGTEQILFWVAQCRQLNIPTLGICLGMQLMCIEFARNVLNLEEANSTEFDEYTDHPIFYILPEKDLINIGGTLRKGFYPTRIKHNTNVFNIYNKEIIYERHRHRFEFNNFYRGQFIDNDFSIVGTSPDKSLVEVVQLSNHPFYIGTQYHPEFESSLVDPHPLFISFLTSCI